MKLGGKEGAKGTGTCEHERRGLSDEFERYSSTRMVRLPSAGMVLLALLGYRGTVGGRVIGYHKYGGAERGARERFRGRLDMGGFSLEVA